MEQKLYGRLADIPAGTTAHDAGRKFVFLHNNDSNTNLTQFAYGTFGPGEGCEMHSHATMEECFYFIKGTGTCTMNDTTYPLEPGCFIRIPPGVAHMLSATGIETLEFIYFGVATQ